jgi:hypothetical protein
MNAERLRAIAVAVLPEVRETEEVLQRLTTGVNQMVTEPPSPQIQQAVSDDRGALERLLTGAASNEFSPAWKEALRELGIADVLGAQLLATIDSSFARNEPITPAAIVNDLNPLLARVGEVRVALENVDSGLAALRVGAEALGPGEYEVGFLIPRGAVHNEVEALGRELVRLKQILAPFMELATGTVDDVPIRSIGSSAFQILLHSWPAVALMLANTLDRLIATWSAS